LSRTYGGDQRKFARSLRKDDMVVCGNANWWIDDDDYWGVVLRYSDHYTSKTGMQPF